VAEVIFVDKLRLHAPHNLMESGTLLVDHLEIKLRIGLPVVDPTDDELVQMCVRPAHRDLEDLMELVEGDVRPDLDTSPNGRLALFERDFELVDRHRLGALSGRHGFSPLRGSQGRRGETPQSPCGFWDMSSSATIA